MTTPPTPLPKLRDELARLQRDLDTSSSFLGRRVQELAGIVEDVLLLVCNHDWLVVGGYCVLRQRLRVEDMVPVEHCTRCGLLRLARAEEAEEAEAG